MAMTGLIEYAPRDSRLGASPPSPSTLRPDVSSIESIYKKYFDFVWSTARRLGVSPAAADDVVQEVFIVIHSRLDTLEDPRALRSWIYGITRRTVSSHHRSRSVRVAAGEKLAVEADTQLPPQTPCDLAQQNDKVRLLWDLLEELEESKREVFVMAELDELSVPEIAESLAVPLNTAYSRLRAARQAFEVALARRSTRLATKRGPCRP
jgi:RNA polymerase sigma-70 factor, ECF subfamily